MKVPSLPAPALAAPRRLRRAARLLGSLLLLALATFPGLAARAQTPGTQDAGFKTAADGAVEAVLRQPDGKFLVGGQFTHVNGVALNRVARLNPDGSVDPSFAPGSGADGDVLALVVQPDGGIVLGGSFGTVNGVASPGVARLTAGGAVDPGFNAAGGTNGAVLALVLQPDGKLVLGGAFTQVGAAALSGVARLNANGGVDAGFAAGGGTDASVFALARQADGKLVLGGNFTLLNGGTALRVARLNPDGSRDGAFNPATAADSDVTALAVQADGRIVLGGGFTQVDGNPRNGAARLNADGTLDAGFNPGAGPDQSIVALALQPGGPVVLGGNFTRLNGTARNGVGQLDAAGNVDPVFNPALAAGATTVVSYVHANALALQPDGPLVVGVTELNLLTNASSFAVVRLADTTGTVAAVPPAGAVAFSAPDYPVAEAVGSATVTVTRSGGSVGAISVNFATVDGTGKAGTDYAASGGTLSWADGDAGAKTFTVPVTDQHLMDGSTRVVQLILSGGNAAVGSPGQATLTITENDQIPTVTLATTTPKISAAAGQPGVLTITRTGDLSAELVVRYRLKGTAVGGVDYLTLSGKAKIKAGKDHKNVTVVPLAAGLTSPVVLKVSLKAKPAYTVGTPADAKVKIVP